MSGFDRAFVYLDYPETLAIPSGVTATILPMPGQNGIIFKWVSGGSLSVVGASISGGCTFAIANSYLVGVSEVINIALSGTVSLYATGATSVVHVQRLISNT